MGSETETAGITFDSESQKEKNNKSNKHSSRLDLNVCHNLTQLNEWITNRK